METEFLERHDLTWDEAESLKEHLKAMGFEATIIEPGQHEMLLPDGGSCSVRYPPTAEDAVEEWEKTMGL